MNLVNGAARDRMSPAKPVTQAEILGSHGELGSRCRVHSKVEPLWVTIVCAHILFLGGAAVIRVGLTIYLRDIHALYIWLSHHGCSTAACLLMLLEIVVSRLVLMRVLS